MFRIGICDDDIVFGDQIEEYLKEYARKEKIEIETEVFLSGEECQRYMEESNPLDLLFLDIELNRCVNGIAVGRFMRGNLANEITQIIYVSAYESYAMQLFQNRPMDFLVKPVNKEDIRRIMEEYKRLSSVKKRFFEFHIGKAPYRIADDAILYFQCSGKKIRIVMDRETEKEYYGSMSDVEKQTDPDKFWMIHKSYIVNTNYIEEFRIDEVVLTTGEVLPISRSNKKKIQEKLLLLNMAKRNCK